jgi:AAA+ ATPase superfamily predicted ATPase
MFSGRQEEIKILKQACLRPRGQLICLYGRRRVGKSSLIKEFASQSKLQSFFFEGLEDRHTKDQIKHFLATLSKQFDDKFIAKIELNTWSEVFDLLNSKILSNKSKKKKIILAFDELQWMAAKRSNLISIIKFYWDNYWKDNNIVLILCGSVASFMVDKVIYSKALYGRIDYQILLRPLTINEAIPLFKTKRNLEEVLKYFLIFGGIPKYIEAIDLNKSLRVNLEELCFSSEGLMVNEFEKIFYSQFKEAEMYMRIVELLDTEKMSLTQIASKLKISMGGGLQRYLENLEKAQIVTALQPSTLLYKSNKNIRYAVTDEYLAFYFKFIKNNLSLIKKNKSQNLFVKLCESKWSSWLGFAFERFVYKNAIKVAQEMGFADEVIDYSPYFDKENKVQVDLMFIRDTNIVTVCEVKYQQEQISTKIIPEMEAKILKLKIPSKYTVEKALITVSKPSKALIDSEYFNHCLSLEQFMC